MWPELLPVIAITVTVSSYGYHLYWVSKCCSLGIIHYLWLLESSCFFHIDFEPWGKGCDTDTRALQSLSHSAHCSAVCLYVNYHLLQDTASLIKAEQCTDMWVFNNVSWGVVLLLCSFSKITSRFPLRPMTYLILNFWPWQQCQVWEVHCVNLNFNQTVVGYSHQIYASVVSVGIFFRQVAIPVQRDCSWMKFMITFLLQQHVQCLPAL